MACSRCACRLLAAALPLPCTASLLSDQDSDCRLKWLGCGLGLMWRLGNSFQNARYRVNSKARRVRCATFNVVSICNAIFGCLKRVQLLFDTRLPRASASILAAITPFTDGPQCTPFRSAYRAGERKNLGVSTSLLQAFRRSFRWSS